MGTTLYLVGAGLTKSLETTRRVPLMMDFAHVLADYAYNEVVLKTLAGMEVGNVYRTACDECLRLARTLLGDGRVADAERHRFAALVRNRQPESIEALFERTESRPVDTPGLEIASGLPVYFRYAINEVFSTIGWTLQLDLLTGFLTRQFEDLGTHIFVSFNYDLALDRAVGNASDGMWQPRNGYGFEFPFYTMEAANDAVSARFTVELPTGSRRIQILKPHGSLNWMRRAQRCAVRRYQPYGCTFGNPLATRYPLGTPLLAH
jgi:hypothetical protein